MNKRIISLMILLMASLLFINCQKEKNEKKDKPKVVIAKSEPESPKPLSKVERGKYLVNTIGCADCHSPKIMTPKGPEFDPDRFLMGHPANEKLPKFDKKILNDYVLFNNGFTSATGLFGSSFAANLTPHETGLGSWTEDQFLIAIRQGKYKGQEAGRDLLPPMPWPVYRNLTDDDLKSIFAYLKTIKPIENVVPPPIPPTSM